MKLVFAFVVASALPASAATFYQGDQWVGQLSGIKTLTFEAPFATPCGDGNWSGCSYQAGGSILAVDDPKACGGWCGQQIGSFNIGAYSPSHSWTQDFTQWASKYILVHFTGQNPVNLTITSAQTEQPASVPLPASVMMLVAALAGLLGFGRRNRKRLTVAA